VLTRHVDGLVMLAVGLWALCVGFGWLPLGKQDAPPQVVAFKRHARWMGPLLVLIASALMLAGQA
jgi:hypothetical protein